MPENPGFNLSTCRNKNVYNIKKKTILFFTKVKKNQSIYLKSKNHNFHKPNTTSILSQLKGD